MKRLRRLTVMGGMVAVLALMCTSGVTLADYPDAVLADNPLGYWRLNETADDTALNLGSGEDLLDGFYIDGVQGVPGPDRLADGTALTGFGAGNVALEVGPDDSYMSVEQSIFSAQDQFTMTGWVQPGSLDGDRIGLFGQNDVVEFGFDPSTTLNMWTPRGAISYEFDPNTEISEGSWFHVAAVGRPGSVMEIYLNGEPVARNSFEFNIGGGGIWDRRDQNNGNQFEGALDEVAIWDVALTEDQVVAHVDAANTAGGDYSAAVLADSPMGYWRLNETQGTTAVNSGTDGASLDGVYNAGDQGYPGPDLPGMGANNVAYLVGPDESFVNVPASPLSNLEAFSMSGWVQADLRLADRIGLWGQNDVVEFGFINPEVLDVWTPSASMADWNIFFDDPDLGDKIDGGEWFHVAMSGDADGIRLYIDGELVVDDTGVSFDSSVGENFGESDFFFNSGGGGVWDATGNQFTGTLDEIAVWDTALTREQIRVQFESALGTAETALQAGDANQDLQFDQLDLVQVQVTAKYLTGQAATWGEGDWNGAPGGSQGNPPAGNGLFDQVDIVSALSGGWYLKGSYGALSGTEGTGDGNATIVYDVTTGEVGVEVPGTELTAVNITSAAGIFTGDPADNLSEGGFDNDTDTNIFKSTFGSSFGSLSFGNVAQTGLSEEFVTADLTVIGALAGGGGLGAVDLRYIPEPSSMALMALGMFGALLWRRRRRS